MPRLPTNYDNTCIYKIVCKDLNITDCYVGHTTDFRKRKWNHKSNVDKINFKVYKCILENGGWDNWDMIEIEKYPCKDANEARARERYWYEELNANLNVDTPNSSIEDRKKYLKEYNEEHKEEQQDYYKNYYETHKEEVKQKHNEQYKKYGDKWNEKRSAKWTCECGSIIRYGLKSIHFKTKKHQEYLANIVVGV
jgi:hypothetical protein